MLSPADHLMIERLYARFNHAIDHNDAQGWANVFTRDGRFTDGPLDLHGHEALKAFAQGRPARLSAQGVRRKQHWITNLVLDGHGEAGNGQCYVMVISEMADGRDVRIERFGVYRDELRKVDGSWFFAARTSS